MFDHEIERLAVDSSTIRSIGYSAERETCVIEFQNGSIFSYAPMSLAEFEAFGAAESRGKWFNEHIRSGKYTSTKLTGVCAACGAKAQLLDTPCQVCGEDKVRRVDRVHGESRV